MAVHDSIRDTPFRDFLTAMYKTECRPGEVAAVTAKDVDLTLGVWTLEKHKTAGKTGEPRIVYLTDQAVEMQVRSSRAEYRSRGFRRLRVVPTEPFGHLLADPGQRVCQDTS